MSWVMAAGYIVMGVATAVFVVTDFVTYIYSRRHDGTRPTATPYVYALCAGLAAIGVIVVFLAGIFGGTAVVMASFADGM